MLKIVIDGKEFWDEENEEFLYPDRIELELEHSLLSLSKWESKHQKPFLSSEKKTREEVFSYIQCMVVTPGLDLDVLYDLSQESLSEIQSYIDSTQSATTFGSLPGGRRGSSEVITSELIYYWLVAFTIPFESESWHLNRLFSLIRIANDKNAKANGGGKKLSRHELAQRYRDLNAKRRAETGSSG